MREALDLRVLAPTEGGISVRHVLMAEAVYGELLSGERVRLHARGPAALSDAPAPLVAHHWYEAGEDDLAFVAGLAAARARRPARSRSTTRTATTAACCRSVDAGR